jgi:hypothetical protein
MKNIAFECKYEKKINDIYLYNIRNWWITDCVTMSLSLQKLLNDNLHTFVLKVYPEDLKKNIIDTNTYEFKKCKLHVTLKNNYIIFKIYNIESNELIYNQQVLNTDNLL